MQDTKQWFIFCINGIQDTQNYYFYFLGSNVIQDTENGFFMNINDQISEACSTIRNDSRFEV